MRSVSRLVLADDPASGLTIAASCLVRSVSRLVLADDPASGLISAAVFCFRRYSAVRPLLSLAAGQLLIHPEQFGYALGFRHLRRKTVSCHYCTIILLMRTAKLWHS